MGAWFGIGFQSGATVARKLQANSNKLVEAQLDRELRGLERALDSDVLVFFGPIFSGVDLGIRQAIEWRSRKQAKLTVILETPGGYIETVQRIVDTIRYHYQTVDFVIPDHAMSAGTVLAMSGDAIFMDYFSVLGPIDPQLPIKDGRGMVPALGYLVQYERLIEKSKKGSLTTAEIAFLIQKFDPAELYRYEQARELTITLLKEWLAKYKFKNWTVTQTRRRKVTQAMRVARAKEIAEKLNETKVWHSHGRGISMHVLREALNIQIEDFGAIPEVNKRVRGFYQFLVDYMGRRGHSGVIQTAGFFRGLN